MWRLACVPGVRSGPRSAKSDRPDQRAQRHTSGQYQTPVPSWPGVVQWTADGNLGCLSRRWCSAWMRAKPGHRAGSRRADQMRHIDPPPHAVTEVMSAEVRPVVVAM